MSNAAMARPMSTGLYLFFFIVRLCLLRQPQHGLWATDSNPASANSVNGSHVMKCHSNTGQDHKRRHTAQERSRMTSAD